jgi:DNA-binding FadR family transcriptional regulator
MTQTASSPARSDQPTTRQPSPGVVACASPSPSTTGCIEFHDLLAEAADNRALGLAREPVSLLFYPACRKILSRMHTQKRILDAHRRIVALLRKRDVDGVRTWMTRHMVDFRRGWSAAGLDMDSAVDGGTPSQ